MNILSDSDNKEISSFLKDVLNDYYDKNITQNLSINFNKEGVELINNNYKKPVSIMIDFFDKRMNNKIKQRLSGKKDIFHKLFPKKNSTLLDCTAGYGRDGYILRSMGFNITMIENSPVMSLLLNNALKKIKLSNFIMYHGNAYDFLRHTEKIYEYIYIDFMFNKPKNSSLSSKNDETLKLISFQDLNKNNLINLAIKKSVSRVVVKEPKHSLSKMMMPEYMIKTKLLNYYIYKGAYGKT
ncbi:MAG: class I SAM-dependent methyltransferase [Gammaproteobacteria bacterium]|nr:class I SAM-dependent methyltransferase [Gammaproteobacteria bacterium]MBT5863496.1 class I SAM-dependent methyltransferase [Gammaproteobacteria bacterium]